MASNNEGALGEATLADLNDAMAFFIAVLIKHSSVKPEIIERDLLFSLDRLHEVSIHGDLSLKIKTIDLIFNMKEQIAEFYEKIKDE